MDQSYQGIKEGNADPANRGEGMKDKARARPWRVCASSGKIVDAQGRTVADFRWNFGTANQANAELIVRAVNSFDALREAGRVLADTFESTDNLIDDGSHDYPCARRRPISVNEVIALRAALALAEEAK